MDAYQQMLPELIKTHRGEWVAVHHGQIVALAPERSEVIQPCSGAPLRPGLYRSRSRADCAPWIYLTWSAPMPKYDPAFNPPALVMPVEIRNPLTGASV